MKEKKQSYWKLLLGILSIAFVCLKLTGNIDWNWFYTISPILLISAVWWLKFWLKIFIGAWVEVNKEK